MPALSTFPQRCSRPLIIFLNRTGPSILEGSSAMLRETITSCNLLATLLMQSRVPLAFFDTKARCWFMFSLVSTRVPSSFSAELLSSMYWYWGLFLPKKCRTLHFLNFRSFLSIHFSTLSRWQQDPLAHQPLLPVWCHQQIC